MASVFTHPLLRDIAMGSSEWFQAQQDMIARKPLVRRCYDLWYRSLLEDTDGVAGGSSARALELGSGSSYLQRERPDVITSDVEHGLADLTLDGRHLPFRDGSLTSILMTHVMHHIPDVDSFFTEAERVLMPGGVVSMVDCTHTPFARFFFSKIHPEPFRDEAASWSFPAGHSMLDSNQALAWIVFFRDREEFERRHPTLRLETVRFLPWFSYLASGGVNLRSLIPAALAPVGRGLDWLLRPLDRLFAIHWHIRLRKTGA